ncbi:MULTISPECIES: MerR family transcriptional regulator [Methylobacterium]|uniref:HTH merR-type domain-containing protein n=1 Tax=Methylobacterium jeotgali TaxID=381630 RepID=A0ABQ4STX3_9HYPH|nr:MULTISPECIES: MerR family transcriptional regulator [Methylobacterium]PIU04350.1 MAG: MerR family transcriptional regulator [Methylobacterium sp. CG09_land_8_20_14_0_10_71_15]PIU12473.1 MAG: MerR family transcriptional regulator [Methylobacterium sp. CG08_land_8_20_14_0_20_71_15]GBU17162.1 hypothetical protein AwMethylo_13770 [Methylobacterium sp.]GJE06567.1 hypothetical protein AOPFMNJM_1889 [Methylobacterium jeotgali]
MALAVVTAETAEKSAGAFRTISEVSAAIEVPQHVLRFWETKFAQIRPIKRAGGRRYYRPEDVDLIKGIRQLLHGQGYTIRGAQRVVRTQGLRFVQAVGRGEAVAGAPSPQDSVSDGAAEAGAEGAAEAGGEPPVDREAIEAVLSELHACKAALAALRAVPEA